MSHNSGGATVESTKDRIVGASAELFRRQGYAGTGVKQIVAEANAPFGSLYHFFPGGKEELGAETIRWSGALFLLLIDAFFDPDDVVGSVERFFAGAAETVEQSGYADACPIATVAGEIASTSEPLREASADVFDSWIERTAEYLGRAGIPDPRAREVAISLLAGLEGAFLLSRTWRSTEPLALAGAVAADTVRAALPES
jgi:AcrR family transcriptional regulator